ncbi:hypothetical protein ACCS96_00615 [Rhizobium ruizarguesonis]
MDYWIERYQTLISAVLAIAGVWFAARPAWRQVELLKIQTLELTRERLAARYRMIRDAIKALEWDQWVEEHRLHPGTPENKEAFVEEMLGTFRNRKERIDDIADRLAKIDLHAEAKVITEATIAELRTRVDRMEKYVANEAEKGYPSDGAVWYGCAQQPDLDAEFLFGKARTQLAELQDNVVEEIVAE